MKKTNLLALTVAGVLALPVVVATPASAATINEPRTAHVIATALHGSPSIIQNEGAVEPQAGPLLIPVVVWAISCAAGGLVSAGGTNWSNPDQVAWGVAGIVVSCLPGVAVGSVVKVILAHKSAVATALKAIGLVGPAAVLCGDSAC